MSHARSLKHAHASGTRCTYGTRFTQIPRYEVNGSTIVAFVVGAKFDASGSGGFKIVGSYQPHLCFVQAELDL
jgi:hypothetical protein